MNKLINALEESDFLHDLLRLQEAFSNKSDNEHLTTKERDMEQNNARQLVDMKHKFDILIRDARLSDRVFPENTSANTRLIVKSLLHFEEYYYDTDKAVRLIFVLLGFIPDYINLRQKHGAISRKILPYKGSYKFLLTFYFQDYDEILKKHIDEINDLVLYNIQHNSPEPLQRMIEEGVLTNDDYNILLLLAVQFKQPDIIKMLIEEYGFKVDEKVLFRDVMVSALEIAKSVKKRDLTQRDVDVNLTLIHYLNHPVI